MIKQTMIISTALALTLSFSQLAFSSENKDMMTKEKGHVHELRSCMHHLLTKLDLTSEQKTKIKSIKRAEWNKMKHKRHELAEVRHHIRAVVESDKMDETKLNALMHQKRELVEEIMRSRMMAKHEIYNVLDAKQKATYTSMANKCEEMRQDWDR